MSHVRLLCLILVASFTGVLCSELICRSSAFRDAAGLATGRGHLIAIASGRGLYQQDLELEDNSSAPEVIATENLRSMARNERTDPESVDREFSLLRGQFGNEESFLQAIRENELSVSSLRERIADQLRSLRWLEKQISAATPATEDECREFYEKYRPLFRRPARIRASHIFLAAPADTPPEVVESKRAQIDALGVRLASGEPLAQLAAEASEDEATKWRGGDLGYFSETRMAPEFFSEVVKLVVGHPSTPFRSHLGFHIVNVTDIRAANELGFEEARGEILLALANQRRALIAGHLADMLSSAFDAGTTGSNEN